MRRHESIVQGALARPMRPRSEVWNGLPAMSFSDDSDSSSEEDEEEEEGGKTITDGMERKIRRSASTPYDLTLEYSCLSPSNPRTISETFRFPVVPPRKHVTGGQIRKTIVTGTGGAGVVLRIPERVRTASFRADAEAFINQWSPAQPIHSAGWTKLQTLSSSGLPPRQRVPSHGLLGAQGWSPDSSEASGSPREPLSPLFNDPHEVVEKESATATSVTSWEESDAEIAVNVMLQDMKLLTVKQAPHLVSAMRSVESLPPSYDSLPAYSAVNKATGMKDNKRSSHCSSSSDSSGSSSSSHDNGSRISFSGKTARSSSSSLETEFDMDAQKLARLHASFHLLDEGAELPLSMANKIKEQRSGGRKDTEKEIDPEPMVSLCGLGYRMPYSNWTAATASTMFDNTEEYDGEQAEIGSSWSGAEDSEDTGSDNASCSEQDEHGRATNQVFGDDMLTDSTNTSTNSLPILSGQLAAIPLRSPLGPNEVEVDSLFSIPLGIKTPPPNCTSKTQMALTFSSAGRAIDGNGTKARRQNQKQSKKAKGAKVANGNGGSPLPEEFGYLVDESLCWEAAASKTTDKPEVPTLMRATSSRGTVPLSPFSPPLTTPELQMLNTPAPLDALPSPMSTSSNNSSLSVMGLALSISCPSLYLLQGARSSTKMMVSLSNASTSSSGSSSSVLARPRPLTRTKSSSWFASTTEVDSVTIERTKSINSRLLRTPSVPARKSSLDLRTRFSLSPFPSSSSAPSIAPSSVLLPPTRPSPPPPPQQQQQQQQQYQQPPPPSASLSDKVQRKTKPKTYWVETKPITDSEPQLRKKKSCPPSLVVVPSPSTRISKTPSSTSSHLSKVSKSSSRISKSSSQASGLSRLRFVTPSPSSSSSHPGILKGQALHQVRQSCKQKAQFIKETLQAAATEQLSTPSSSSSSTSVKYRSVSVSPSSSSFERKVSSHRPISTPNPIAIPDQVMIRL